MVSKNLLVSIEGEVGKDWRRVVFRDFRDYEYVASVNRHSDVDASGFKITAGCRKWYSFDAVRAHYVLPDDFRKGRTYLRHGSQTKEILKKIDAMEPACIRLGWIPTPAKAKAKAKKAAKAIKARSKAR